MSLNGHSDNFHYLSLRALNPMEIQGDLISAKISGKSRKNGGTRYIVALLSRSSVDQVEDAEFFRNLGNRYPRNVVRLTLCSLVNGKIKNRAEISTRKKKFRETEQRETRISKEDPSASIVGGICEYLLEHSSILRRLFPR